MSDILHDFPIFAAPEKVFDAVSTPAGLDAWWTLTSAGPRDVGARLTLDFGPGYRWSARVTASRRGELFELVMEEAMPDWLGTRLRFELSPRPGGGTDVRFAHLGWPAPDDHYRISSYCWAMYLRLLRRWIERGEVVPYAERLDA